MPINKARRSMTHQTSAAQAADQQSQLFSVRLWHTRGENDRIELWGKAQHVLSGASHHFHTWQALQAFLSTQMDCAEAPPPQTSTSGTR
jgi:hypothetical protein